MYLFGKTQVTSIKIHPLNNNGNEDIDPFKHSQNLSVLNWIQIVLMSITIAPIRSVCIFILFVFAWILSWIGLIGLKETDLATQPLGGWRSRLQTLILKICRAGFFCMGVHKLEIIGLKAERSEAPIIVAAPHSSLIDAMAIMCSNAVPIAKYSLSQLYLLGTIGKFQQVLFVNRGSADARQDIKGQINARATNATESTTGSTWRQLFIFPEGTCTNGKALIKFKIGAFQSGLPVQPVIVRFSSLNKPDVLTWTWNQTPNHAGILLWLTLCQFNTKAQVEYLPVYNPDEAEVQNPRLFADHVQVLMAKHLEIPTVDRKVEDVFQSDEK